MLTRSLDGSSPSAITSNQTSPVKNSAGPFALGAFGLNFNAHSFVDRWGTRADHRLSELSELSELSSPVADSWSGNGAGGAAHHQFGSQLDVQCVKLAVFEESDEQADGDAAHLL